MDSKTSSAYSNLAATYSEDWLSQPSPTDMYELITKYFHPRRKTAGIGCGNGRDAFWLHQNGFPTIGFDSSAELLELASKHFPTVKFQKALLPELHEIQDQFENVLCETVVMHLTVPLIIPAVQNLKRILKKDGRLYLSWRVTEGEDARHADGRLYSAFSPNLILNEFSKASILHFEDKVSVSSGKRVCRLIIEKVDR